MCLNSAEVRIEILDEATRNIAADRPDLEPARIERRFTAVRAATDGHDQPINRRFADTSIINPKDRHVMAAALHHGVDYIVTTTPTCKPRSPPGSTIAPAATNSSPRSPPTS